MIKELNRELWIKIMYICLIIPGILFISSCQNPSSSHNPVTDPPQATEPSRPPNAKPALSENNTSISSAIVDKYLIPKEQRRAGKDFQLPTLDGKSFQLSSLRGTIVLIDFTTTWCYFCKQQEPHLVKLYEDYHQKSFEILSIFCKEDKQTVLSEYPSGKHIYPILLDLNGFVATQSYGLEGYPLYVLLDKQGNIAYTQSGYNENMYGIVSQLIEMLNSEE